MLSFFSNAMMLWALLAVALPIIIEIIFRLRRRQVDLPTIRYLLRNPEEKKMKRQDRLLLILRCLIPFVLAAAMARPLLSPDWRGGTQNRHVTILIDTTVSMGQQAGVSTAFALAKKKAVRLIRALPEKTQVTLASLGHRMRIEKERTDDLYALREHVEAMKISHGAATMSEALPELKELVTPKADEEVNHELYILSDFQKATWLKKSAGGADPVKVLQEIGELAEVFVVDVGGSRPFNYFITALEPEDPLLVTGKTVRFDAQIEAKGVAEGADAKVRATFLVNGEKKGSQERNLATGSTSVSFTYRFGSPGEYLIEVAIEGDNHRLDNRRYYLASVPDQYDVLIVEEGGGAPSERDSWFLASAVTPRTRPGLDRFSVFGARSAQTSEILREDFDRYAAVCLLGMDRIPDDLIKKLEPYIRDGGRAILFFNKDVNRWEYNEKLYRKGAGVIPARLVNAASAEDGKPLSFSITADTHPIFRELQAGPSFKTGGINTFMALDEKGRLPDAQILASFSNGKPALMETRIGKGQVFVFCMAAHPPENFMATSPEFPVLIQELLRYSVGRPDAVVNLESGEVFKQDVLVSAQHMILRKPDNTKVRMTPAKVGAEKLLQVRFEQTDRMGMYEIDAQKGVLKRPRFVVNLRAQEGDLARLDEDAFASTFTGRKTWVQPSTPMEEAVGEKYSVVELSGSLLWCLAALLAAESFLAWKFGKRRK